MLSIPSINFMNMNMDRMDVHYFLYILFFALYVTAQDNRAPDENNHFIYPPLPGPQFSNDPTVFQDNILLTAGVKQSEPFKWVSNLTSLGLYLQQEGNGEYVKAHNLIYCDQGGDGWLYWDGELGSIDLRIGSIAYLAVWNCSEGAVVGTPVFFSHYFNLTEAPTSSASASSAIVTSETASPTTEISTTASHPSATTTPSSARDTTSPAASHDLQSSNDTAVLAGGIGGGIGGAIIIVAVAVAFWKLGRRKRAQDTQEAPAYLPPTRPTTQSTEPYLPGASVRSFPSSPPSQAEVYTSHAAFKPFNSSALAEMSSQPTPIELPSDSARSPPQRFQMD